jgi:hypothetical protein
VRLGGDQRCGHLRGWQVGRRGRLQLQGRTDDVPELDSLTPSPDVDTSDPEPRRILGHLRCAALVLKYSRCQNDLLYGRGQCSYGQLEQLSDRFGELGCPDLGWAL